MALDSGRRVLCFDGRIEHTLDFSLVNGLEEGGLFVVRSFGGDGRPAVLLAEALRRRRATVVVYDYCLYSCASYLLFASSTAFVFKGTLVAWSLPVSEHLCSSFEEARDDGPKRLENKVCSYAPPEYQAAYEDLKEMNKWYVWTRAIDPSMEYPPQTAFVRRVLRNRFGERGRYPSNLLWTWNPRYYASTMKTRVVYEAYPENQDEVDTMTASFDLRVIYDP
ncbi:MAG: hypothetical protein PS018_21855 [bacterium]|nr:hypothetical protein [bacterium]